MGDRSSATRGLADDPKSVRRRLWVAMIGLAVVPMAGGMLLATALLAWDVIAIGDGTALRVDVVGLAFTTMLIVLAVASLMLAVAQVRNLVGPIEELADSRERLAAMYVEAQDDAMHDSLTGLGNHRAFQEELARQVALFHRNGLGFVLLLVDIDNLKATNDAAGHGAGDELIINLALTMRETLRESDRLFRVGGDEFAVIMPVTDVDAAFEAAARLRHFAMRPRDGQRPTSISGGISAVPRFAADREQAYAQADAALLWAKRHGRATIEVFDAERDRLDDSVEVGIANAVHDIVQRRSVSPVYQPFVDLRSGDIVGYEGLVRPDPSGLLSDARRLFDAAAATGWTVELDMACVNVVAAGAARLAGDQLLSINLSSRSLELKHFDPSWLLEPLRRFSVSPRQVIVELTERDAIADMRQLQRTISTLQGEGFRIAADDVGSGNAGLRLLSQIRFDFVKLDLSLVHEGVQRAGSWAILRSLSDMAASQGSIVIAEGIETPEQLWLVQDLRIPVGQGYLLGRPGPSVAARPMRLPKPPRDRRVAIPIGPPASVGASNQARGGTAISSVA